MPRYQVTLDGQTFVLDGDHPPSEQEARTAWASHQQSNTAAPSPAEPTPEGRSVGGFLGNVASSGGRFLKDTATGLVDAAKFIGDIAPGSNPTRAMARAEQAKDVFRNAPRMVSAAGSALKNRYGGLEQMKNTLYTDPVGVASDLSTVLMPAKAGLKAGGFAKLAKVAGAAETATNPIAWAGKVAGPLAHGTARTIVRGTLRPPAAVRADFGGAKGVADAVLKNRVYSEASSQQKLTDSVATADKMIADAQAAGVPGVRRVDVARSVLGEPRQLAQMDQRLGITSQSMHGAPVPLTQGLDDTAKAIFRENPSDIALTDAQNMKRRAQTLAFEAGADNNSIKKAAEKAKAQALRAGIETRVPQVKPVNERSQELLGAQKAFSAAEDRPRALTNFLSILGGGAGFAGGGPAGAALVPLLMKAADSPRAGALAGIGINELGRGANSAAFRKALLARLLGQEQE